MELNDFIEAYYSCRKHKRNKPQQLEFELDWMTNIVKLYKEVKNKKYEIGTSICFLVYRPKLREVFAANFRDRIIHHVIMQKLEPLFEDFFIPDTYNCRKGKGSLYGVKRLYEQIKECSENYTKDCWIGKFDMQGFFMSIDKNLLWKMLEVFIKNHYKKDDIDILLWLVRKVVLHCPHKNCIFKGCQIRRKELNINKSLFTCGDNYGLPIGNLTSQHFANFYLSLFDKHMKQKYQYYGRYVDDFFIIGNKQEILQGYKYSYPYLKQFHITLHPDKIYIQPYYKGVKFLGYVVKKKRVYIGNHIISNIYNTIYCNKDNLLNSIISYKGFLKWSLSRNIRLKIMTLLKKMDIED